MQNPKQAQARTSELTTNTHTRTQVHMCSCYTYVSALWGIRLQSGLKYQPRVENIRQKICNKFLILLKLRHSLELV